MHSIEFFEGFTHLGSGFRSYAISQYYYCEACGEVWARVLCSDPHAQHRYNEKFCPSCWNDDKRYSLDWRTPLLTTDLRYADEEIFLSKEVLARDFLWLTNQIPQELLCPSPDAST